MTERELLKEILLETQGVLRLISEEIDSIIKVKNLMKNALINNHKIIVIGNGGSATQAQHFVAELVGRFREERNKLPAITLTTNTATITAISNDFGYEKVFRYQLEALGEPGDVLIALSTSGESPNIIEAVRYAKKSGISTVGITGMPPNTLSQESNTAICIKTSETPRIQEAHLVVLHILCELFEKEFTKGEQNG